jgi:hypothetical protein
MLVTKELFSCELYGAVMKVRWLGMAGLLARIIKAKSEDRELSDGSQVSWMQSERVSQHQSDLSS